MRVKEKLHLNQKIKSVIGFIIFIAILCKVFCNTTYLFRNTSWNRAHIVGIENEDLDMIYIGGSAAYVYWQPLKAWNDCGFTSYSYANDTVQAESIKAYLEQARTTQNPELYVIGVRAFQYYSDEQVEAGLRNGTDSMDLTSPARYKLLNDYFKNRNISEDTDVLSYYLDIAKYHTNTANLGSSLAWSFINNKGISANKGWEWIDLYGYLDEPQGFQTDDRAELPENAKKILVDLLEYCKTENLNVLFVVCPYYLTMVDQAKYNTIGDIVERYGFDFLNTNDYYDEMGIDFSQDFYNKNHVNLFGAEKYTAFLENYITSNYNMPDHRGDSQYESWNDDYQRFRKEYNTHAETVTNLRLNVEKGNELEQQMHSAQSFFEWYELVNDSRYKLLIASAAPIGDVSDVAFTKVLGNWSMDPNAASQIRVIQDSTVAYSNSSNQASAFDGTAGIWNDITYHISIENGNNSILINGEEVLNRSEGMNIVVYDNNYRRVADIVTINVIDGEIILTRE